MEAKIHSFILLHRESCKYEGRRVQSEKEAKMQYSARKHKNKSNVLDGKKREQCDTIHMYSVNRICMNVGM